MKQGKQRLVWIGSIVPEDYYKKLCSMGYKNQQASRIAQLNIIKGLEFHYGIHFDYVSGPSLPAFPRFSELKVKPYEWTTAYDGIGLSASYLNIEYINRVLKGKAMENIAKYIASKYGKNDDVTVYINSPHTPFIRAGFAIKKMFPDAKLILIIPDLPQFMESSVNCVKKYLKKMDFVYMTKLIKKIDYFVLYASKMRMYLGLPQEKCVVMEGCVSEDQIEYRKNTENTSFVFMYSGTTDRKFGLNLLIDAFISLPGNYELIITGNGDAANYIKEAEKKDSRIHYYGFVDDYKKVKQMQVDADVLINMRLPSEPASDYCFPSKLFEYMKTGNPVISFKIGGIGKDYYEHLIIVEDESVDGLKKAMEKASAMTRYDRYLYGVAAKKFIMTHKNYLSQTKKIFDLVQGIE